MAEKSMHHTHEISPRLINWVGWSVAAGALALLLRSLGFLYNVEGVLKEFIVSNLVEGQSMTIAPRWCYLAVYLTTLLLLTAVASFYKHPWRTLPQIIITLFGVAALSPILALWNVYFLGPSLLFSVMVCSFGAWITAWFIKDQPLAPLPKDTGDELDDSAPHS